MELKRYILSSIIIAVMLVIQGCPLFDDDANDNPSPQISTNPIDGATKVSVHSQVTITFPGPIDETSINIGDVLITYNRSEVPLNDDYLRPTTNYTYAPTTYTLTLTNLPLYWGYHYRVRVQDILDINGNKIAPVEYQFSTYDNSLTQRIYYNSDHIPLVYYYNNEGNRCGHAEYSDAGPDSQWFTDDDILNRYSLCTYSGTDQFETAYIGSGNDGRWFTADDQILSYERKHTSVDDTIIETFAYLAPGADNTWLTEDDIISSYKIRDENIGKQIYYNSAGPDQTWFTSDDVVDYYYEFDDTSSRTYTTPGFDGVWFTSDDTVSDYNTQVQSDNGSMQYIHGIDAGPDAMPLS